jgi:hypothetical protein
MLSRLLAGSAAYRPVIHLSVEKVEPLIGVGRAGVS